MSISVMTCRLDFLAARAYLREHGLDALAIYGAQPGLRYTEAHPALLGFHPEAAVLQVRQKTPPCLVVGVGNVVTEHRLLAGDLADAGHGVLRNSRKARILQAFRRTLKRAAGSQQPAFRKRHCGSRADDEMVEHLDVHQRQ